MSLVTFRELNFDQFYHYQTDIISHQIFKNSGYLNTDDWRQFGLNH